MDSTPRQEHRWLERLVGEWSYQMEAAMTPGAPTEIFTGRETVRSLGGRWVVCEGTGDQPEGGTSDTLMSLGFDPDKGRFIGSFIGSQMDQMWLYDGELDPSGESLVLMTEGPSFETEGATAKYRDVIECRGDERRLTSSFLSNDGDWRLFMTVEYRRVR